MHEQSRRLRDGRAQRHEGVPAGDRQRRPSEVSLEGGAVFPVVGVGLDWSQADRWAGPAVVLWVTGTDKGEAEVYLRPEGARALVHAVTQRLAVLDA